MKSYWSIPGLKQAPLGEPCIAFNKYDGSNLRFEYNRKRGWNKFGTRRRLFDETDPEYGIAIPYFREHYAEQLTRVFNDNKNYRGLERATVYCEFFGEESFAGWHNFQKPFKLKLFDVEIYKRGFVLPNDFVAHFGHLDIAEVVYQGTLDNDFIHKVRQREYNDLAEGVVAKGVKTGKKASLQHGLWMVKIKTQWWFDELRRRAKEFEFFKKVLEENEREQIVEPVG